MMTKLRTPSEVISYENNLKLSFLSDVCVIFLIKQQIWIHVHLHVKNVFLTFRFFIELFQCMRITLHHHLSLLASRSIQNSDTL